MSKPLALTPEEDARLWAAGASHHYEHTAAALRVRYRLHLTPAEYLRLCQAIVVALPRLELDAVAGTGRRVFLIYPVLGRWTELIYDLDRELIITALTPRPMPLKGRARRKIEHFRRRAHPRGGSRPPKDNP
ncbi:hypothetical protein GO986_17925 [Deinococcus sp. HMF7620]|uniref:Uncharacterized protein n=1 Tax=Deinococcus arboris TaxID=2682977 RepID=A0A7C9LP68_9DEIO|nr:hypothetical protein [Deinococcus arboris]MVN88617.1 hypothetical protein [Deinococcus arboris]